MRNLLEDGLLQGTTDIHTHLLPGVDDGFKEREEAYEALRFLEECGIRRIYLTPHVMTEYPGNTLSALRIRFEEFQAGSPVGIELRLAAEYMLDSGFAVWQEAGLLTMSDRHVLVETSYLSPPTGLWNTLYELSLEGYSPIVAHPERYQYMTERDYVRLRHCDCKLQLNLLSLTGYYGRQVRKNAFTILEKGLYDFVGSDLHALKTYQDELTGFTIKCKEEGLLKELLRNNESLWQT